MPEMSNYSGSREGKGVLSAFRRLLVLLAVCTVILIIVFVAKVDLNTHLSLKKPGTTALENLRMTQTQFSTDTEPMVMSLDYYEQIGNGAQNLFDLQCWASSVGIRSVVEPSVLAKWGSTSLMFSKDEKYLKFRDLYDITHWNFLDWNHWSTF